MVTKLYSLFSSFLFLIAASTERPCSSAASISSRTLGKTLAHVQAIIQEGACNDAEDAASGSPLIDGDSEDESLFDGPPFTPPR